MNALPITVDAGTTASSGVETLPWQDDLADSATAGTCKSCHDTSDTLTHMQLQGGSFAQPKAFVASSAQEGCSTCHAAGRTFDSAAAHCGALPFGQCAQ